MTNKMVVMKPFMSDEGLLQTGTVIDGSKFRNTRNLVNARYLRPVDDTTPEAPAPGDKNPVMASTPVTEPVMAEASDETIVEAEKPKRRRTRKTNNEA